MKRKHSIFLFRRVIPDSIIKYISKMVSVPIPIPVAILIFEKDGSFEYKAFSPENYNATSELTHDDETPEFDIQYGQFLARIYNHISYNYLVPTDNTTSFGRLQEIHIRTSAVPVENRGDTVYFSTYCHSDCKYQPIHKPSPIFYKAAEAAHYAKLQTELIHLSAPHSTV